MLLLLGCIGALFLVRFMAPLRRNVPVNSRHHGKPVRANTIAYKNLMILVLAVPQVMAAALAIKKGVEFSTWAKFSLVLLTVTIGTHDICEVLKNVVSRPRPDFIARCKPNWNNECTGDPHEVRVGRQSFPSGHSATAMSFVMAMWCTLSRFKMNKLSARILVSLSFVGAICIGISRYMDHKHFYSDIVCGGAISAVTWQLVPWMLRSTPKTGNRCHFRPELGV